VNVPSSTGPSPDGRCDVFCGSCDRCSNVDGGWICREIEGRMEGNYQRSNDVDRSTFPRPSTVKKTVDAAGIEPVTS
jgi:hypothetical protein